MYLQDLGYCFRNGFVWSNNVRCHINKKTYLGELLCNIREKTFNCNHTEISQISKFTRTPIKSKRMINNFCHRFLASDPALKWIIQVYTREYLHPYDIWKCHLYLTVIEECIKNLAPELSGWFVKYARVKLRKKRSIQHLHLEGGLKLFEREICK